MWPPLIAQSYVTPRSRRGLSAAMSWHRPVTPDTKTRHQKLLLPSALREVHESAKKCGAIRQRMPRSRVSCPVHGSGGTLLTLANCLSTTVSITLSTIPVEAPDCHSDVGWPSVDHVAIYPHESGTAPHFLALPKWLSAAEGSCCATRRLGSNDPPKTPLSPGVPFRP